MIGWKSVALAILLALALLYSCTSLLGHEAASGWRYPNSCCSNRDCKQVSLDDVIELGGGAWMYLPLRMLFPREKVLPSGDANFHVCYHPMVRMPLCLFVVQGF